MPAVSALACDPVPLLLKGHLAPVKLVQRVEYQHSLTAGLTAQEYEPSGKAAFELKKLYEWTAKQVNLQS